LFTCWLDQIIWMPMEKFGFSGTDHILTVEYTRSGDEPWRATAVNDQALNGDSSEKEASKPVTSGTRGKAGR